MKSDLGCKLKWNNRRRSGSAHEMSVGISMRTVVAIVGYGDVPVSIHDSCGSIYLWMS